MRSARVGLMVVCAAAALVAGPAEGRSGGHNRPGGKGTRTVARPRPTVALGVHEAEYRIRLTRSSLPAGQVVVELRNLGQDPHNLVLRRVDGSGSPVSFAVAGPGSRQTRKLTLTSGTWILYCSVSDHEQRGMKALVTVR